MKNMKKKILFIGLVLVTSISSFLLNSNSENLAYLMVENIEALAYGEMINVYNCIDVGSLDCPINQNKVKLITYGYSLEELY